MKDPGTFEDGVGGNENQSLIARLDGVNAGGQPVFFGSEIAEASIPRRLSCAAAKDNESHCLAIDAARRAHEADLQDASKREKRLQNELANTQVLFLSLAFSLCLHLGMASMLQAPCGR